jgi:NADH dehydrogenase
MLRTRRLATVFGGSGFIGRYVVQRLAAQDYVVRVAVRDTEAAMFLRPMGRVGQIVPLYAPLDQEAAVARAVEGADVVINLTGILAERRGGDFMRVHAEGAGRIARLAASSVAQQLVHVSAIGADRDSPSLYARSKAAGEDAVRGAFAKATILRPSIVFGPEDSFFNRFANMATLSPVLPIVGGNTKFQPVYVGDVADAVMAAIAPEHAMAGQGKTYALGGPQVQSFRQLMEMMLAIIERPRRILDLPPGIANLQASVLERLPGKLLTRDQIALLARDNVVAPDEPGLPELGITPTCMDLVLPRYLARYRPGGRSKKDTYHE